MRRNLQASIKAAQVSASSYTTTRSLKTAHGSAFPFSARPKDRREAEPGRNAKLPYRGRPAGRDLDHDATTWHVMDGRCTGTLDESEEVSWLAHQVLEIILG